MRKTDAAFLTITLAMTYSLAGSEDVAAVQPATATPIKHLVVIFGENVSFDHYFGTYLKALNPAGEPFFKARPDTPGVNGLTRTLREHNPTFPMQRGTGAQGSFDFGRPHPEKYILDESTGRVLKQ